MLGPANLFTKSRRGFWHPFNAPFQRGRHGNANLTRALIPLARRWFKRSRLWRFVFLCDPQGFFDPTPGLAPALLAQRILPIHVKHLLRRKAAAAESLLVLAATDGEINDAADDVEGDTAEDGHGFCPITGFDHTAIEWCMPSKLRRLEGESAAAGAQFPAVRFWVRARIAGLVRISVEEHACLMLRILSITATMRESTCLCGRGTADTSRVVGGEQQTS